MQICPKSPEFILFIASVLDRCIMLIFQDFIFNIKCHEKLFSNSTFFAILLNSTHSADWICTVAVQTHPVSSSLKALERAASADTSHWVFYAGLCRYVPGFFVDAMIGALGDTVSRKLALALPTLGLLVCCWMFFLVACFFPEHYSLTLGAFLIYGLAGSFHGFVATS